MSRKRNEYFDISDEGGIESESNDNNVEDSRFSRVGRSSVKRQKLDTNASSDSEGSTANRQNDEAQQLAKPKENENEPNQTRASTDHPSAHSAPPPNPKLNPLTPAQLAKSQQKARKTGCIYISRVPPFMKPQTLRHLLQPYGEILRIFLTPESVPQKTKRVRAGGNKRKRSFVDGWVEFASKKKAKVAVETLNGNIIGGKKNGFYHDDLWNMKYLKGFKWNDLMEQVHDEARIREGRLRAEIQQEARERRAFLENVETAKKERGMEAKRARKTGGREGEGKVADEGGSRKREMIFRQNRVREKNKEDRNDEQQDEVKKVLRKIF